MCAFKSYLLFELRETNGNPWHIAKATLTLYRAMNRFNSNDNVIFREVSHYVATFVVGLLDPCVCALSLPFGGCMNTIRGVFRIGMQCNGV